MHMGGHLHEYITSCHPWIIGVEEYVQISQSLCQASLVLIVNAHNVAT